MQRAPSVYELISATEVLIEAGRKKAVIQRGDPPERSQVQLVQFVVKKDGPLRLWGSVVLLDTVEAVLDAVHASRRRVSLQQMYKVRLSRWALT